MLKFRPWIPISSTFLPPGFTYGVAGSMGPFRLGAHVPSFVLARVTSPPLVQNRAHTTTMPRDSLQRPRFTRQSTLASDPLLTGDQQCKGLEKLRREIYKPMLRQVSLYYRDTDSRPKSQEKQDNEDGKRCAVCLDDFKPREMVTLTPCNHMFHDNCIIPWVKSRGQCPVCRFVISEENKECERTLASNNRELGNDPFAADLISFLRDMEARS
nr:putative RING-H2 finger protein ATL71 [Tanacetum cinerariifolium]